MTHVIKTRLITDMLSEHHMHHELYPSGLVYKMLREGEYSDLTVQYKNTVLLKTSLVISCQLKVLILKYSWNLIIRMVGT